jgi:hypothetical protein
MSQARYYLFGISGYSRAKAGGSSRPTIVWSILDRAYAHREVARFTNSDLAKQRCAELNKLDRQAAA